MINYSIPGIFNALDTKYGMVSGLTADPQANATALQNAINDAEGTGDYPYNTGGGGIILIPSDDTNNDGNIFPIAPPGSQTYCVQISGTYPILIMGTGGATTLLVTGSGDLFTTADTNNPSVVFQDLIVQYDQAAGPFTGTAFNLSQSSPSRLMRVQIQDCQFPIDVANTFQASVTQCFISYSEAYPPFGQVPTCFTIGGLENASQEVDVDGCIFSVPTNQIGSIGVLVNNIHGGLRIRNSQIIADTGIKVQAAYGPCDNIWFSSLEIAATSTALYIQPDSTGGSILVNLNCVDCNFEYTGNYDEPTSGIYIDTNGEPNSNIDTVRIVNCNCIGFPRSGVQVTSGQNISIVGGLFTSNGVFGIEVTGVDSSLAATNINIKGASCIGNAFGASTTQATGISVEDYIQNVTISGCLISGNSNSGINLASSVAGVSVDDCAINANAYGLSVSGNCLRVYVNGCDLNGNTSGPLSVSSPGQLQITNCPGYNDQRQVIATAIPVTTGVNFNGLSSTSPYLPYYGPVVFYISAAAGSTVSMISVGGSTTHLTSGTFFLGPPAASGGVYAAILFTGSPNFLMLGR